jgi:single-strand DNA-binding protein
MGRQAIFDVVVWGAQGENSAQYLAKGRQVAIDCHLEQRSWEAQDGTKRNKIEIIAENVVFLGGQGGETREPAYRGAGSQPANDAPAQDVS